MMQRTIELAELIYKRDGYLPVDMAMRLFAEGYNVVGLEDVWTRQIFSQQATED
jgi:hypothetical protein